MNEKSKRKRIVRDRRLTPAEASKYKEVRKQIAEELPQIIERHQDRMVKGKRKGRDG
jgi:hypothetical protein